MSSALVAVVEELMPIKYCIEYLSLEYQAAGFIIAQSDNLQIEIV